MINLCGFHTAIDKTNYLQINNHLISFKMKSLIRKKEVEAKAIIAQCCAKISKTIVGCHD